ncbi:MAG: prepilin-type N-terminal cleavage/methylation domain-containing protein [Myxococcota bacterium]|nr:prepilin-type N-terminal cleavage/methylation domain-containing protein [Myxococcota bacterium]
MRRRREGFTLFELLAVVAMLALLSALALPNFGIADGRAAHEQAKRLAAELELARARALATGEAHRLVLDVDEHHYWLERLARPRAEREANAAPGDDAAAGPPDLYEPRADEDIQLTAPVVQEPHFEPLPGPLGIGAHLPAEVRVAEVEQEGVVASEGVFEVPFAADGTTEPLIVRLASEGGRIYQLTLPPWAGDVRIETVD